jgi:hypothetical protein
MEQIVFTTGEAPEITLHYIGGNLRLAGWEQNQFQAEAERRDDLKAEQTAEGVTLSCRSDCAVFVPQSARVNIHEARGDIKVKSVGGPLEIQTVNGCLILRQTGAVSANSASCDVNAKRVGGALKLGAVAGSVSARSVAGDFEVETVNGDLYLGQGGGNVRARVGGDCDLRLSFTPGHSYALDAGGDVRLRALARSAARFEMQAGGDIAVSAPGAQTEGSANRKVATVGQDEAGGAPLASVTVRAGGDVSLSSLASSAEWSELSEDIGKLADEYAAQIENQIQTHMADLERQLAERLSQVNVPPGAIDARGEEVAAHVRAAVERVSEKARRKAEAAQRKAERDTARDQERRHWSWKFEMPARPGGAPPAEPVGDAERLSILRMLEQGKISVAEAERLLAALEGQA